jgi:hypothetical protein
MVQGMLFACLGANYPDMTFAQTKALVTRKNWAEVWAKVLMAWTAGLAEPDPEEDAIDVGEVIAAAQ